MTPSMTPDRKSTRLNSSHITISYAVFCLNKKNGRGNIRGSRSTPRHGSLSRGTLLGNSRRRCSVTRRSRRSADSGSLLLFFFNETATTEIYTLSLHDALPITPSPMSSRDTSKVPPPRSNTRMVWSRSEEHTSELQSHHDLVCRLLLEKKKKKKKKEKKKKKKKNQKKKIQKKKKN